MKLLWSLTIFFLLLPNVLILPSQGLSREQLREKLVEKINGFKLDFHKSIESRRLKRSVGEGHKNSYSVQFDTSKGFEEERVLVRDLEQVVTNSAVSKDLDGVSSWMTIEGKENFYLAWGLQSGGLRLAQFNGPFGETIIRRRFTDFSIPASLPYKMSYFVNRRSLWMVVAYKTTALPRTYTVAIYQINGTIFTQRQVIQSDSFVDLDILQGNQVLMAMSTQREVKMYVWKDTQFDEVAEKKLVGVRSVALVRVASDIYLATAQTDPSNLFKSQFLLYKPVNRHTGSLISHQTIETKNEFTKVYHFVLNGNDYLAFVGPQKGVIYWWAGDAFLEYQVLENVVNAREITALTLPDGEILLAAVFTNQVTFLTQSSDARFVEVFSKYFDASNQISTIHLSAFAGKFLYSFIAFRSNPAIQLSPVWKIKLIPYYQVQNRNEDPLTGCLRKLGNDVKAREERLKQLSVKSAKVWVTNRPQNILAPVIVEGSVKVLGSGSADIRNLMITTNNTQIPQITNSQLRFKLDNVTRTASGIGRSLIKYAYKGKSQTIRGKLTFALPVQVSKGRLGKMVNSDLILNGIAFKDLHMNVLRTEGDQVITGKWTFGKGLTASNILVGKLLNGIKAEDVLLTSSNSTQIVTGNIMFGNMSISSMLLVPVIGYVNGMRWDDIVVGKSTTPQILTGLKRFSHLQVVGNVDVKFLTNGQDLAALSRKAVKLDSASPQHVRGKVALEGIDTAITQLHIHGLVNNVVNISRMAAFGVRKSSHQVILGRKTFLTPLHFKNVRVGGLVNGLNFSRDIVTTTTSQSILASLVFKAPVVMTGKLETLTLNGIDIRKEAVLRSSPTPQLVTARKGFMKGISVTGDISMDQGSTIDDVDPSELPRSVMNKNQAEFHGPIYFDQITIQGKASASKGINGYGIGDLPTQIWLKSANQVITSPVTFLGPVTAQNLIAGTVNGMIFPEDFVLKSSSLDQVVSGEKIFLDEVKIPNGPLSVAPGVRVNNIDIVAFENEMVKNVRSPNGTTDAIYGVKTFGKVHVKGNIFANKVNNLDLKKDVMLRNVPQRVLSPIVMSAPESIVRHGLHTLGNVNVRDTVNGLKMYNWAKQVVTLGSDGSRPITNKYFLGGVTGDKVVATGSIGGVKLMEMRDRVVTLSTDQVITAPKNFTGKLNFGNHVKTSLLNGVNITEYVKRVVRKDVPATIFGDKVVRGKITVYGALNVTGRVNDVNITELATSAVSKTRDNIISAPLKFNGNLNSPDISVTNSSRIDGLYWTDLIFLNQNTSINGRITFADDISVAKNLNVGSGIVSGCNLQKLVLEAVPLNNLGKVSNIHGRKTFTSFDVDGDIKVGGLVNLLNISQLANDIVTLDTDQVVTAPLVFKDALSVEKLILHSTVNGINLKSLFADSVLKSRPQAITGRKIFMKDFVVTTGQLVVGGSISVRGFVDGVNVTLLSRSLVTRNGNQRISGVKTFSYPGPIVFRANLFVDGVVMSPRESVKIPSDLVLLNTNDDHIPGDVVFAAPVVIIKNVTVGGTIDGIDLRKLIGERISLGYQQEMSPNLIFKQPVTIDNLVVRRSINGIPVSELVTKKGNHVLRGSYRIKGNVMVAGNLEIGSKSLINGFNFPDLAKRTIDVRRGGHVSGQTYITNKVNIGKSGMNVNYLNGLNITSMVKDYRNYSSFVNQRMEVYKRQANVQEKVINRQTRSIDQQTSSLEYFDLLTDLSVDSEGKTLTIVNFLAFPLQQNSSIYTIADELVYWKKLYSVSCPPIESVTISFPVDPLPRVVDELDMKAFPVNPLGMRPFYVWSNSSTCSHILGPITFQTRIMAVTGLPQKSVSFVAPPGSNNKLNDVKSFKSGNNLYIVMALGPQVIVYRFDLRAQMWLILQTMTTSGSKFIELVELSDQARGHRVMMFVANEGNVHGSPTPSIIYEWNEASTKFNQYQAIFTTSPSSVKFMVSTSGLLLAVSNEKSAPVGGDCSPNGHDTSSFYYNQPVQVYRWSAGTFELIQTIEVTGVSSLTTFNLPPSSTFLAVGSKYSGQTIIFKFEGGTELFSQVSSIPTRGVTNLLAFWSRSGDLLMAVSSDQPGQSKILRAVISGPLPRKRSLTPFNNSINYFNPSALLS